MALRKFLYLDTSEGVATEQSLTDTAQFGGATLTGVLSMGGSTIQSVGTPVNATDAATKQYVDNATVGISWKPPCIAASATNVASLSGTTTVDGIALVAGNRVLLTAQTTASQNGPWVVQSGAWTRPTDFAAGASAAGSAFLVEEGTNYASTGFTCSTIPGNDVVGTNSLTFVQFTSIQTVTAGNGLTKSGNQLSVVLAANSALQFTGGALDHLLDPNGGIYKTSNGLGVTISGTTLANGSSGLSVLGVPSAFTVAGTATTTNVTAVALNTLTAGAASAADSLHTHNAILGAQNVQQTATNGSTALSAGDPVAWSSTSNILLRGDCSNTAASRVIGLASAAIAASNTGTIVRDGIVLGCLTSATPGTPYWLAAGGGLTATIPTASGSRVVRVGFSKNATDLQVKIQDMGTRS